MSIARMLRSAGRRLWGGPTCSCSFLHRGGLTLVLKELPGASPGWCRGWEELLLTRSEEHPKSPTWLLSRGNASLVMLALECRSSWICIFSSIRHLEGGGGRLRRTALFQNPDTCCPLSSRWEGAESSGVPSCRRAARPSEFLSFSGSFSFTQLS